MSEVAPEVESPPRRRLSARRRGAFVAALALGPVLLLEAGLRLLGWPTAQVRTISHLVNDDPDSWAAAVGMFRPGARATVLWPPQLRYSVSINALGLRGPELTRQPAPDRPRVLCVGDSFTFGFYAEEDATLPARLESWLGEHGLAAEVVNGGVGGWSVASETLFVEQRGIELGPRLVLLTFSSNDVADLDREPPPFENFARGRSGKWRLLDPLYQSAIYELTLRIKVALKQRELDRSGEAAHPLTALDPPPEKAEALWADYERWLRRLQAFLRERGVSLAVLYAPDPYKLSEGLPPSDGERLERLCQEAGVAFVSAQAAVAGPGWARLFSLPHDPHPSPLGYARLAETAGAFLLEHRAELGLSPSAGQGR